MIEQISITNLKCHAHTEIALGKVTALVGPNGAGKSTLLLAIYALNQVFARAPKHGAWSWEALSAMVRRQNSEWGICVTSNDPVWQIEVVRTVGSTPRIRWEVNQTMIGDGDQATQQVIVESFGQAVYFKGIAKQLSLPSTSLTNPPQLSTDGSGLAPVLANLMTSDRKRRSQIEQSLCEIVPTVREINARIISVKQKEKKVFSVNSAQFPYEEERDVPGNELIFNTSSGNEIPAHDMSDGTLLTLGLLTLLHGSSEDVNLFLLDDVEQGLHPLAQRKLMQTLKGFAEKYGRQIILTSHSPYIVDELEAKDVWVMATDKEGISHCKRLSDHPDIKAALGILTTGETWSAEGEDWVLTETAQPEEVNA